MVFSRFKKWGIEPLEKKDKTLNTFHFFSLWSSLGIGLLVISAGTFLSNTNLVNAILAIIIGSITGSILLALAGKIGSDRGVTSILTFYPSFGRKGAVVPAILNIIQLIGWTTFEILIMTRALNIIFHDSIPSYIFGIIIGGIIIIFGLIGPPLVIKKFLSKIAMWIAYISSIIIIVTFVHTSNNIEFQPLSIDSSFFQNFDLVIAMPISWMPLVSDYNRFAKKSRDGVIGTMIGFSISNILLFTAGFLLGASDIFQILISIQSIFYGVILLILLSNEIDNAFADVYSATLSFQSIFSKFNQLHIIIFFTFTSVLLSFTIPIIQYENFLLLIGSVFVPLFGIILTDYYLVKNNNKNNNKRIDQENKAIGYKAIFSWLIGIIIYLIISPISPIYGQFVSILGSTIPSLIIPAIIYYILNYRH